MKCYIGFCTSMRTEMDQKNKKKVDKSSIRDVHMVLLPQRFGVDLLICNKMMAPIRSLCQQVRRKISIDEIKLLFLHVMFESDCDLNCNDSIIGEDDGIKSGKYS